MVRPEASATVLNSVQPGCCRLNVEAQQRAEAAEKRREEERDAREAKRLQAFRAAGGEALTKSLAEQARWGLHANFATYDKHLGL